jgi:hypothetical protein
MALVLHGEISEGIRWMEQSISKREQEGYRAAADWYGLFLCEIYLEIISGTKPPPKVIARNILTLVAVMFTAQKRICALTERARQNPMVDPDGHHIANRDDPRPALQDQEETRVGHSAFNRGEADCFAIWADPDAGTDRGGFGRPSVVEKRERPSETAHDTLARYQRCRLLALRGHAASR